MREAHAINVTLSLPHANTTLTALYAAAEKAMNAKVLKCAQPGARANASAKHPISISVEEAISASSVAAFMRRRPVARVYPRSRALGTAIATRVSAPARAIA